MINRLFTRKRNLQTEYKNRLIETIKLLSAPPDIQFASFPDYVCKPDEIALTFDEYEGRVNESELVPNTAKIKITSLNKFFVTGMDKNDWTEDAVFNSKKWKLVRKSAKDILDDMGVPYSDPNLYWIKYVVK